MNDTTTTVHIVESEENLLRDLLDERHRDTLVLMPLDETKQILAKDFEDHADMCAVGSLVPEVVEERNDMGSTGMCV